MRLRKTHEWLIRGERRTQIVARMHQPLTARQLASGLNLRLDTCSRILLDLERIGLITCLTPGQRRSRVYWLTQPGLSSQTKARQALGLRPLTHAFPIVDWNLYSWLCYAHRSAVLKAMREPMQPSTIKRRARLQHESLRMSANNCRDIMRLFVIKGIVVPVRIRKKKHLRYEPSAIGLELRQLLIDAPRLYQ